MKKYPLLAICILTAGSFPPGSFNFQIEGCKVGGADKVNHGLNFGWLNRESAEIRSV